MVITRIFGLVIDGVKTDGLVPYADMLNHKRPRDGGSDTKWTYDDSVRGFTIVSLKTIPRGEQVYDSYGRKCNSRFFVNYGFSLEENEDNEAMVQLELPVSDPQFMLKLRMINHRDRTLQREYQIPASYKEKKSKEMFGFLRFVHAKDAEMMSLAAAKPNESFKVDDVEPLSVRNEIEVLKTLAEAAKKSLATFDHTLEEDQKLIKSGTLEMYSNERNCVLMRMGEKEVLHWFISLADFAVPLLQKRWNEVCTRRE